MAGETSDGAVGYTRAMTMRDAHLVCVAWLALVLACGSNGTPPDAGADASVDAAGDAAGDALPKDAGCPSFDASFTCNVSSVASSELGCGDWVSAPNDSGTTACPEADEWSAQGNSNTGVCTYKWITSGSPDLCELPESNDGGAAFSWLEPACAPGCP
jgi:hypothetical protein